MDIEGSHLDGELDTVLIGGWRRRPRRRTGRPR
jgi:hypothetical protein